MRAKGWHGESARHSLAARGVKTGRRLRLVRVPYGRPDTPPSMREYKIDGVGAVGTLSEYEEVFPDAEFDIVDEVAPKQKKSLRAKGRSFSAETVLQQLGGNRFVAMTGAHAFVKDDDNRWIAFKIGRNAKSVNYVKITLNNKDLYDMEFGSLRAGKLKVKSEEKDVYFDQLQELFTEHTGMHTRL